MTEQEKLTAEPLGSSLLLNQEEEASLGDLLRQANIEIAASLQRIQQSREESARLAAQTEVVMSKLRADWL
jgi:hypothetical protein